MTEHFNQLTPAGGNQMTGIELIAAERRRQIEEHGFDAAHDDLHTRESLARAAAHYALPDRATRYLSLSLFPIEWDSRWDQKGENRIKDLSKAGALIAAEIDRLQRLEESDA